MEKEIRTKSEILYAPAPKNPRFFFEIINFMIIFGACLLLSKGHRMYLNI
jgi:hypothetical protein